MSSLERASLPDQFAGGGKALTSHTDCRQPQGSKSWRLSRIGYATEPIHLSGRREKASSGRGTEQANDMYRDVMRSATWMWPRDSIV